MSFLILSEGGDGLGIAVRLLAEGHKTTMWIRDSQADKRGVNIVEKDVAPIGGEYVTMLADCTGSGVVLDAYKASGGFVYGGSQFHDELEGNREFATEIFDKCGIQQPESQKFTDWESAVEFIKEYPERLVFKPEGRHSGNIPSYVSRSSADLLNMLDVFKKAIGDVEVEFVLQEFIKGTCISSEAWFCKGRLLSPTNHTLERKQLMVGDLGPSGGCSGNIVWVCSEGNCPLCEGLRRLEKVFKEHEYTGPIDINSVVSSDGEIYALEFTPRFGYDAFPTFLYGLFEGDFGAFIAENCRGFDGELPVKNGFAAGVRISTPPFPTEKFHSEGGKEIGGLSESNLNRFYPYEVDFQENTYATSAGYGVIGVAIGFSTEGIEEAFEDAYDFCKKIHIPDMQYRTDLGEVFKSDLTKIRRSLGVLV
jgi:phosphoribosylamine--glycine ligase